LLTFVDGDPDRPLIAGAINTAAAPGPVTADNQTESVIQTGGHNKIRMGDEKGKERVVLSTPLSNSWIRMGAHNDPITLMGSATVNLNVGDTYTEPAIGATTTQNGVTAPLPAVSPVPPLDMNIAATYRYTYTSPASSSGPAETAVRTVNVFAAGDSARHNLIDQDGIRIQSGSTLWLESAGRYGNYKSGTPSVTDLSRYPYEANVDKSPAQIGNMLENFGNSYNPTNLLNYKTGALAGSGATPTGTTAEAMVGQDVTVSSLDTFTTQEGNIYDFGGYWNYNLGNSYAEDDVNQKAALNRKEPRDMLNIGGPGWNSVNWPQPTGTDDTADSSFPGPHWAENQNSTNGSKVWVQKKWGHDYEYHIGDSISVSQGNTLNVIYGGTHIETKYYASGNIFSWTRGGDAKSWSSDGTLVSESKTVKAASGVTTDEKKYDYNTGDLCSHTTSAGSGMGMAKFDFDYSNTVALAISTGSIISSETFMGAKITNENFIGGKISMEFALAGIVKIDNTSIVTSFPGFRGRLDAFAHDAKAAEAKTIATDIQTKLTTLNNAVSSIDTVVSAIFAGALELH
jgi:hypothetical protein